jgi:hypothetical protein
MLEKLQLSTELPFKVSGCLKIKSLAFDAESQLQFNFNSTELDCFNVLFIQLLNL